MANAIYIPAEGPHSWRALLAEPDLHWKRGRSALELAAAWSNGGLPRSVAKALSSSGSPFAQLEMLIGLPEHRVPLAGGRRASQTDLFVLGRTPAGALVSLAVEGKAGEAFGPLVREWFEPPPSGKEKRLAEIRELLQVLPTEIGALRYQLLHRTASAIKEARRFGASYAVMLVHSFSAANEGHGDLCAFAEALGAPSPPIGGLSEIPRPSPPSLHVGWVNDTPAAAGSCVLLQVDGCPPAKSEALSMLGVGHPHAQRVRALLEAARSAASDWRWTPAEGPVALEVTLVAPAKRDPWDATNYLGGIADVLQDKRRDFPRLDLSHLGDLRQVSLFVNDRQVREVAYRQLPGKEPRYSVLVRPLAPSPATS
jgi:uncharacterized protein DUF6946